MPQPEIVKYVSFEREREKPKAKKSAWKLYQYACLSPIWHSKNFIVLLIPERETLPMEQITLFWAIASQYLFALL